MCNKVILAFLDLNNRSILRVLCNFTQRYKLFFIYEGVIYNKQDIDGGVGGLQVSNS
jgi:hypothetical protein